MYISDFFIFGKLIEWRCFVTYLSNDPRILRSGLFGSQKSEVHTSLLHYCTFGLEAADDAQNVRGDRARGKDNDQQNISKNDNVISQHI